VFDSDYIAKQSFDYPDPQKASFPNLATTCRSWGELPGQRRILARSGLKPDHYKLKGKFSFQECSNQICKILQSAAFEIPFQD
jgi:hypothetical protein